MHVYSDSEHVNVGSGVEVTILKLTRLICEAVGFKGAIPHDLSKPDGTPRKLMSSERLKQLGWASRIGLKDGIESTYDWFGRNIWSSTAQHIGLCRPPTR
jgi:GDP-L-fucose synthase